MALTSCVDLAPGEDSGQANALREEFPSHRLKIVNLPSDCDAEALRSLFSCCGTVHAPRVVVKCKPGGTAAAYGYIGFSIKQEADNAIQMFDEQVRLPGAPANLGVYYAKPPQFKGKQEPADAAEYNKLYFSAFNKSDSDALFSSLDTTTLVRRRLLAMFGAHGRVRQLQLYKSGRQTRDTANTTWLVTGTVTMFTAAEAVEVLLECNKAENADGAAPAGEEDVQVTWAEWSLKEEFNLGGPGQHSRLNPQQARFPLAPSLPPSQFPQCRSILLYSKVPITIRPTDLAEVLSQHGRVLRIVPGVPLKGLPLAASGHGFVHLIGSEDAARSAVDTLNGSFMWPGSVQPMELTCSAFEEGVHLGPLPGSMTSTSNGRSAYHSNGPRGGHRSYGPHPSSASSHWGLDGLPQSAAGRNYHGQQQQRAGEYGPAQGAPQVSPYLHYMGTNMALLGPGAMAHQQYQQQGMLQATAAAYASYPLGTTLPYQQQQGMGWSGMAPGGGMAAGYGAAAGVAGGMQGVYHLQQQAQLMGPGQGQPAYRQVPGTGQWLYMPDQQQQQQQQGAAVMPYQVSSPSSQQQHQGHVAGPTSLCLPAWTPSSLAGAQQGALPLTSLAIPHSQVQQLQVRPPQQQQMGGEWPAACNPKDAAMMNGEVYGDPAAAAAYTSTAMLATAGLAVEPLLLQTQQVDGLMQHLSLN